MVLPQATTHGEKIKDEIVKDLMKRRIVCNTPDFCGVHPICVCQFYIHRGETIVKKNNKIYHSGCWGIVPFNEIKTM